MLASPLPAEIPFVRQPAHSRDRMCGAAALAMLYRRWNPASQLDDATLCQLIWDRVSTSDERGGRYARCHRLAADLCHAGIPAAAFQASQPWQALTAAHEANLPSIVNYRVSGDSPLGHFAVLAGIDCEGLMLHDPQHGPHQRLDRESFLRNWQPGPAGSEIAGHGFVVASPSPAAEGLPAVTPWTALGCQGCGKRFPLPLLRPLLLAVAGAFCPWCDRGWQLRVS